MPLPQSALQAAIAPRATRALWRALVVLSVMRPIHGASALVLAADPLRAADGPFRGARRWGGRGGGGGCRWWFGRVLGMDGVLALQVPPGGRNLHWERCARC